MLKYLVFILLPLVGFFFVRYGLLDRQILDLSLFLCVLLLCIFSKHLWLLIILVTLFTSWQIDGVDDYYWLLNFTIVCIAVLKSKENIISNKILRKYSLFLVLYVFFKSIFDLMISDFVEGGDRIAGPFTSSLHLAYFSVIYSFVLSIIKPSFKIFQILLLLIATVISGSRVGAAGVFVVLFFQLSINIRITLLSIFLFYFIFNGIPEIRVLSYIPDAENIRFAGFTRYLEAIVSSDPFGALFGYGRKNYGAVGFRFFGDDVFITESSMIMLFYCYGLILGPFLFVYICSSILKIGRHCGQLIPSIVIVLFIILSPFIDSPAIFFVNMILLASTKRSINSTL